MTLPLAGFTVVSIEQAVAAPLATRNLADLGARVVKVERIDGGDFARGYDHVVHGSGSGDGATIEVSMFEATVEWMGYALYTSMYAGRQPARKGLSHSSIAPYDAFPTRDGQILIGVQNDSGWRTLATEVLEAPSLADDPRFVTNVQRVAHRAECDAEIAARTSRWSAAELDARLAATGIPAARLKNVADVVEHPQLRARDRWRKVGTEHAEVNALLPPVTFADVEAAMGVVPALGQHTRALLTETGVSADDLIARGTAAQASLESHV